MRLEKFAVAIAAIVVASTSSLLNVAQPAVAGTIQLIGLNDSNSLLFFNNDFSAIDKSINVIGVEGTLLGIDIRPANGLLYGITSTNRIYTISPTTGAATLVSTLSPLSFDGGTMSGFDFNPVPDRLRLVGSNNQNFRINVDTGAIADFDPNTPGVQPDKNLAYATGDTNFGVNPNITAAAYINSFRGGPSPAAPATPTRTTQLFGIDSELDILVLQNPPNNGTLVTIGSLGVDFGSLGGFDIFSRASGDNTAFAASGSSLYTIDLSTGSASLISNFDNGNIIGLAATGSS